MDFSGDFNSEYTLVEANPTLEETMDDLLAEEYYSSAPVQASSPLKSPASNGKWKQGLNKYSAVNQLSQTLPYYRRYEDVLAASEAIGLNTTVPDEEIHSGPVLPLDPSVVYKLKSMQQNIAMKQEEIDQIYLNNAKVAADIADAKKVVQVTDQVVKQKKKVRWGLVEVQTFMKSEANDLEAKIETIQAENRTMKPIDSLPAAQKDQARKSESKQCKLEQKDFQIQQLEKKLNSLKNASTEDASQDEQLNELENELFLIFEKISKHSENMKDLSSAALKNCEASGENTKALLDSSAMIKATTQEVAILEMRIRESSIILHKHKGVFHKSHPETDELIAFYEGLISQNLCWKKKCEAVQSEANKTTEKLANIKRNFRPQGYGEANQMEQLKDANSKKASLIKDIRSLRAIITNCKLALKECSSRTEAKAIRIGLQKLQKELNRREAKNFKLSDEDTKGVKGDFTCDDNALKWASASA